MTATSPRDRIAWEDRFRTPKLDELLGAFNRQTLPCVELARSLLQSLPGAREELAWQGVPWRWTLTYWLPGSDRAAAFLVLEPNKPRLAFPISGETLGRLNPRKMSKSIRDGIVLASEVGGVRWACWELTGKAFVTELFGSVIGPALELSAETVGAG